MFTIFTVSELFRDNQQWEGVFLCTLQSRSRLNESETKLHFPGYYELPMTTGEISNFSFIISKRVYRKKYEMEHKLVLSFGWWLGIYVMVQFANTCFDMFSLYPIQYALQYQDTLKLMET